MNWTELIKGNIEYTYGVTQSLLGMVDDGNLDWKPSQGENWMTVGQRMLQMVGHLNQHKGQLYYYLKLQGKPVNTMHLWGM